VQPLFANTEMAKQQKKLLNSLILVVENLRNPQALGEVLNALGARHIGYGTIPVHYPAVGEALLTTFEQYLQQDWTPEVRQAWVDAFTAITALMLKGAAAESSSKVIRDEKAATLEKPSETQAELQSQFKPVLPRGDRPKKPLVSSRRSREIIRQILEKIPDSSQQFQPQLLVQRWVEILKKQLGKIIALFWALAAIGPLFLLQGLVAGMIGPGPALTLVTVVVGVAFLWLWITLLREAERG
jgi:hemoglobin-like flavoprotein